MKITHFSRKTGEAKITAETLEDLWHLENILSIGDKVGSRTLRTVKVGTKEEKKPVFIAIYIEEIKFFPNSISAAKQGPLTTNLTMPGMTGL